MEVNGSKMYGVTRDTEDTGYIHDGGYRVYVIEDTGSRWP